MRILITSGYGYWGDFLPTDLEEGDKQVGGGETSMLQISRQLAKQGHEVFVFYDVKRPGQYYGIDFLPTSLLVPIMCQMEFDALISWDNTFVFRYADRAKIRVLVFQLNDASIGVFDNMIDLYLHPSQWHADRFHSILPEMTKSKSRPYLTNGISIRRYLNKDIEREPYRVIYSSSPDRGLHHLLRIWPKVVEAVPKAELHVYYDMDRWLQTSAELKAAGYAVNTSERADLIRKYKESPPPSVFFHGGIGQKQLAEEQLRSKVMVYPCDPVQPTEGFSMTCLEALTAGCYLITSNADALPELWQKMPNATILPLPIDDETWVNVTVETLLKKDFADRSLLKEPLWPFHWSQIGARWEEELKQCLAQKQ